MKHPQVTQWLAGERSADLKTHLDGCQECAAGIAKLEAPLAAFHDAVHGWSERQITPMAIVRSHRASTGWLRMALAATALAVIAIVGIERHNQQAAAMARADDALLDEVAMDVSRSVPATLEPLDRLMSNSYTDGSSQ
jgi:hypothetical protein